MSAPEGLDEAYADFTAAVTLSPKQLEEWLETAESTSVGQKPADGGESTGHESGRRIVAISRKNKADLDEDDVAHMRKVVGYVQRHTAQGPPADDAEHSPWRYSLMNWGHDPLA